MTKTRQPFLDAFAMQDPAPILQPGRARRVWMDKFTDRHPYRCLPLTMANSTGWELLCPFDIDIHWDGGDRAEAITFSSPDKSAFIPGFAQSHFSSGIVTFHTGYLFRTPKDWALWCMGAPNWPKDGIYALAGLIETDWLPFPFTMNWQMTRPGTVRFEQGEPFCFITLMEHRRLEPIEPKIRALASDPALARDYAAWNESRGDFIKRLSAREDDAVSQGWQRHYMRGTPPSGSDIAASHDTKRRLKAPKDVRGAALRPPPKL